MAKSRLTDRFIKSRKAAPSGERKDYPDAVVPGLALRITDKGHKSFVLIARYPLNPRNPTRRVLGKYGALTLEGAREKARSWLALIDHGIDPKMENRKPTMKALIPMKVLSKKQLGEMGITWTNQHLRRLEAAGKFPKRIHLGPTTIAWLEEEIDAWVKARIGERTGAA